MLFAFLQQVYLMKDKNDMPCQFRYKVLHQFIKSIQAIYSIDDLAWYSFTNNSYSLYIAHHHKL